MAIQDFLDSCSDMVDLNNGFSVSWSRTGVGFGSFYFRITEAGSIQIDNECMGKDFIKGVLCRMVDEAILDDNPSRPENYKPGVVDIPRYIHDRATQGTEPLEDTIILYSSEQDCDYQTAKTKLQNIAYGGKPPYGYDNWDMYWGKK